MNMNFYCISITIHLPSDPIWMGEVDFWEVDGSIMQKGQGKKANAVRKEDLHPKIQITCTPCVWVRGGSGNVPFN